MTEILLNDAPGGERLINRLRDAAADMALAFVGEPDGKVRAHLEARRAAFTANLAGELGADAAAAIVDALIKGVMGHKHELESRGRGSPT